MAKKNMVFSMKTRKYEAAPVSRPPRSLQVGETQIDTKGTVFVGWLNRQVIRLSDVPLPQLVEADGELALAIDRINQLRQVVRNMVITKQELAKVEAEAARRLVAEEEAVQLNIEQRRIGQESTAAESQPRL